MNNRNLDFLGPKNALATLENSSDTKLSTLLGANSCINYC